MELGRLCGASWRSRVLVATQKKGPCRRVSGGLGINKSLASCVSGISWAEVGPFAAVQRRKRGTADEE